MSSTSRPARQSSVAHQESGPVTAQGSRPRPELARYPVAGHTAARLWPGPAQSSATPTAFSILERDVLDTHPVRCGERASDAALGRCSGLQRHPPSPPGSAVPADPGRGGCTAGTTLVVARRARRRLLEVGVGVGAGSPTVAASSSTVAPSHQPSLRCDVLLHCRPESPGFSLSTDLY